MLNYYEIPLEIYIKCSSSVFIPGGFLEIDVITVNTSGMSSPTPVHSILLPSGSGILSSPTLTFETSPYLCGEEQHELYTRCIFFKKKKREFATQAGKAFSND